MRAMLLRFVIAILFAAFVAANPSALLKEYCFDCHGDGESKGQVALDQPMELGTWERVINALERGEMPPKKKRQPTAAERAELIAWIEKDPLKCDCSKPDPGRVTIRRLNRAEYNNTIRELLGIDFRPADDFPVDDSGYGFDNIGDALALPPILMEKYLAAAESIVDAAFGMAEPSQVETNRFPIDLLEVGYNAKQQGNGWVALNSIEEDDVATTIQRSTPAEFVVRVRAFARQESERPIELTFMLDQQPLEVMNVATNETDPRVYEMRVAVPEGRHRVRATVRRNKDGLSAAEALRWKSGSLQKGAVYVEWLELEGPYPTTRFARKSLLPEEKEGKGAARKFIEDFARRAFRRPLAREERNGLIELMETAWKRGGSFKDGIAVAAKATLVSPHFLYRGELQKNPGDPKHVAPIDEYALASRLSYFLWSSMPDAELFREAEKKTLRKNLRATVRRMLADPKSKALVENFGGQWLQFRNVSALTPDENTYNKFDEPLRDAMRQETALLFETILREDRSVLEFLNADYTFVNDRLARHYGIEGVKGSEFQRVSLARTPRRGVLAHASILALTSNPTRTSPVKRGQWVLENLLNAPAPPPPPDVPELKEAGDLQGTLRERTEKHRDNPLCASCHARMDPIGFGLENFDGIGSWRTTEGKEKTPIDATGELTTGEKFSTPLELVEILANEKRDQFLKALAEKSLTYALGRGPEYYDRCAIKQIVARLKASDHRFSELVLAICESAPFQLRRGDGK